MLRKPALRIAPSVVCKLRKKQIIAIIKNIEIEKIEELDRLRENENFEFRAYLKGQDSGKIDKIVHRLNYEISNQIDEREQYFKYLLCSFLKEKKCTVYNDRPEDCSSFPHLNKKDFNSRLWEVIKNY